MITQLENYQLEIDSILENVNLVEQLLDTVREELNVSDDIYGNMMVAVTEAVNNAIIHGNQSVPIKKVKISVAKENDHIIIFYVKDEGSGFDFNNLPDPTAPENLEKPTGRGVFLMTNLSDLVVFSNNGSLVEIQFKL
jgi:anti-sigma regulatory factor (Ser/Thr protein kinase)